MNTPEQNTNAEKPTALYRFFSNPIVGIAGSIASVIGLGLAIYFYVNSSYYRDLVYLVYPANAVVVKAGQPSRLAVTLDGKTLSTDVTAAQVAFWNQGNAAIRNEHVLQTFRLVTSPQARIIEATVRKKSRELVRIDLDTNQIDQGELGVSWNILEQGDGAILQIIFAGPPNTPISINAVIEGQRTLRKVETDPSETSDEKFRTRNNRLRTVVYAYLALSIVMMALGIFILRRRRLGVNYDRGRAMFYIGIYIGMPAFMLTVTILMWVFLRQPEPPFGL